MCAGRVLRSAQLGCLHVECGAAAEHRTCRHRVCRGKKDLTFLHVKYFTLVSFSGFSLLVPGMITKEPCGSMATRQALRMLGVSAAEMPHNLHVSFRRLLRDCKFLLLSRMLQSETSKRAHQCVLQKKEATLRHGAPLNSPCPILPSRPITTLHGRDVTWTRPTHHSHSFCKPTRLAEPFFLRAL